ncbi:elongation factor Ts [Candidatus Kuenenbacteria bacterium RIFCSPLOWO2_12_FULL_42_13]|uniref:Elongation factor Ts n=4 Tax=Candidatus Kueneniibacteriota TaxID=1752740 RepID=A0A0G1B870_9BACT|nr:MAG: Elongation factor Ts [Candidatus Kuenenbacteria bacterium GW2011_GWA2_42_15]OGG90220.1 MAG: elongation factor Ts [Candidatus Kuenenbacteria bacterium RIFCSPLOWO2_02_FULL_42_16]OGG91315.1 MAG: elongation factor Ts [Candidatus Kuenenbacteria bacterium RIFCSPLOWO2_12_FULL_42_13]OGG98740.1 MAG: elongation factor Ts [Candidatus Kuenenbacteria bacterium RIFCSPHIGHO2_12_FULL_42_14]
MANLELVQKMRTQTGAGIMDIKQALEEANGDENQALEILRKKGRKIAAKKQAERTAKDGIVEAYIHAGGKIGSMVLLACETDFVAKNTEFKALAKEIAMQVAAMKPEYVVRDDVPVDVVEKEKEICREQLKQEGKPEAMWEKIAEGKLDKFFEVVCLLDQPYIKDDKKKVKDLIDEATAKLGEKIEVKQMIVFGI